MICPACRSASGTLLYSPGPQPLVALNLPYTQYEAENSPLYSMNFHICRFCGHVFNVDFDYAKVPYVEDSNLMYNSGEGWADHLSNLADGALKYNCHSNATIIDIGAGDGGFLKLLKEKAAAKRMDVRCVAFEPGIESRSCKDKGLETHADYFVPRRDLPVLHPRLLLCRHVLEHLQEPRDFVADIAYYANMCGVSLDFIAEVPCITKALNSYRFTDFLYEHPNNFTQRSLRIMFENVGWVTHDEFLSYNDEVAVWIGSPAPIKELNQIVGQRKSYWGEAKQTHRNIHIALDTRRAQGKTIAFFGGTGKGAAFLNTFRLTTDIVVDSDVHKVGRYVPGTGQEIESIQALKVCPVDVIVITTRWRAADIYAELQREGIEYEELLVLQGCLREYTEEQYVKES